MSKLEPPSFEFLLSIIGDKEVQLYRLRMQLQALQEELAELKAKSKPASTANSLPNKLVIPSLNT